MITITENQDNIEEKDPVKFRQNCSSILSDAVSIVIFALVTVFPLIYHRSYYDILQTKYHFYRFCILTLLALLLILSLGMLGFDLKNFKGRNTRNLLSKLRSSNWKKTFSLADGAVLGFWLASVISTLQSDFIKEAISGDQGRYSGLLLLTLYAASYFIISHFWNFSGIFLELFLASGMLMCLFGITDYFQMDIMHFRTDASAVTAMWSFTSTIGNINTYTAYIGMILGLAAAMFVTEKKPLKRAWYYLCLVISLFAIIMGRSDNAYLSLGAVFILLPFLLFSSKEGIKKYLILTATLFSVFQVIDILNQQYVGIAVGLDSLSSVIANFKGLPFVVIFLWAAVTILCLSCKKSPGSELPHKHRISLVHIWGVLILLSLLIICFLFVDANIPGHAERYGSLSRYLIINDSWGSSRGYIWRRSAWMYDQMPFLHKLFGCGPDTYGCLVNETILSEVQDTMGTYLDNAHNAFLQYLITMGLVGLITYIFFLGTAFRHLFQNREKNPYIFGILLAVICYAFQSLVNLDLPVVTPAFWLLISMGMSACKKTAT